MAENAPPAIEFGDEQVLSLTFHPTQRLLATSLINGQVHCYNVADDSTERLFASQHHKSSCRTVQFSPDGSLLFSGSKDKSIQAIDVETHKVILKKGKAHDNSIYTLKSISESVVASGDESGNIRLWDLREKRVVQEYQEHDDFISDMHYSPDSHTLISTGGDGYLSVFDIRKKNVLARSDNLEDELLSLAVVKNGKKVIVGTEEGVLDIFSWGWWGDVTDRFPGHPSSVDTLCKVTENLLLTGSSDGVIRLVNVFPNQLVEIIGRHKRFPIEDMSISHDQQLLASCSHDHKVKFWNISRLYNPESSDDDENEDESQRAQQGNKPSLSGSDDDWEDIADDDDKDEVQSMQVAQENGKDVDGDQDSDDDDDDEGSSKSKKRKKRTKLKKGLGKPQKKQASSGNSFFDGL
ncbi:WD domain repeat-containing protein 55 [Sorochytrium milnesiophthora]